jgi:hypothetical protein
MPSVRKFKEMGVGSNADVPEIDPIETSPRPLLSAPESDAS